MMKKFVTLLAIAALTALGTTAVMAGQAAQTGVNGSWHDITYLGSPAGPGGYNQDDFQRVCIFCHTPHNAQANGDVPAPLWNHEVGPDPLKSYSWAAPSNNPILFDVDPLIGPSRLCMGCHDGITAVDKHGPDVGTAAGTAAYKAQAGHVMGSPGRVIDLSTTHPIGFLYSDAFAERGAAELIPESTNFILDVPTLPTVDTQPANRVASGFTYVTGKKISDTLYGGYMTCASCHEVHNTRNAVNDASLATPGYTPNYFVWAKEKNSALCLSCHVK